MRLLLVVCVVFFCLSCRTEAERNVVSYEIFVRSFADSNQDGIGDLAGLSGKLDYLQQFGIKRIWVMPIMKAPSYHKYDVVDYKSIDPEYGTEEDFKKLVKEAHQRNIKIIVDLVMNHTSEKHPWFVQAVQDPASKYHSYYVWSGLDSIRDQLSKKVTPDSENITQWHSVGGDTSGLHYYGFFSRVMPDLNFDNPEVREEFVSIGKYWLSEMDVDGFRLDAARHIYPEYREDDTRKFWAWFRKEMEDIKPDVYMVGEVWKDRTSYLPSLHSVFNYGLGGMISTVVRNGQDTIELVQKVVGMLNDDTLAFRDFEDATLLRNHDQNRILSDLGDDVEKTKVAAGLLLTLPGAPYLYYGEEIGMKGVKPDENIREPFLWDNGTLSPVQTTWVKPHFNTDTTVTPLAIQKMDSASLFNFYRRLLRYRNGSKVLINGSVENTGFEGNNFILFKRVLGKDELLVFHNLSDVEITFDMALHCYGFSKIDFDSGKKAVIKRGEFKLPAFATVILK